MNKIDTEKLALFHQELRKLASDSEENWYLAKRILSEMELEDLYENPMVDDQLLQALQKLERIMDVLLGMKQITSTLASDYETLILRHQQQLSQMGDYVGGLRQVYTVVSDENQTQRAPTTYSYTAPVVHALDEQYAIVEVVKDE